MTQTTLDHGRAAVPTEPVDYARGCRRFVGRSALLTASARGLGLASALRLAAEGAEVWITDRDADALAHAADIAARSGLALRTRQMDSADRQSVDSCLSAIVHDVRRLDILVNNAGGSLHTPYRFQAESDEDWHRVMELNLMGAVWATQAVLPTMTAARYGRIVNFGSKAGRFGSLIAGANYAAAKGAIAAFTRQLAIECGPDGITVNCICPGIVMTERTRGLWTQRRSQEERERVLGDIPLRRHCEVEDVAASVAFLASDDAAFITGITQDLNGGQAMA